MRLLKTYSCPPPPPNTDSKGFTLAEVLITLGIIGIIAALTLPSLINNYQEKQTVAKLKKSYSVLSNAVVMAVNEYGTIDTWDLTPSYSSGDDASVSKNIFWERIGKYLKISEVCDHTKTCKMHPDTTPLGQTSLRTMPISVILNDNTYILNSWIETIHNTHSSGRDKITYGDISVDINGKKKPNVIGKDIFNFFITDYGLVPNGEDNVINRPFNTHCRKNGGTDIFNGYSCTAWVIYNENMDYLHCDDLNWHTKTKCD